MVGIGFIATEAIVLNARIRDYDEGVYWQSIRALGRGEPLFSSVFASQPPAFYYLLLPFGVVGHSLASLRLSVLILGLIGLAATYVVGRRLAGPFAGLAAILLVATSPLYLHQSGIVQADGPAVAVSVVAVAFSLLAVRAQGHRRDALAFAAGLTLAVAAGFKLLGAITLVPMAVVLLAESRARGRLLLMAVAGAVLGTLLVLIPAIASPGAAFQQLVLVHLRAGAGQGNLGTNLKSIFLLREIPLELLAAVGVVVAVVRRNSALIVPGAWLAASILAVLLYHPLFAHHLVILSPPLALVAAVGLSPHPQGGERKIVRPSAILGLGVVILTAAIGAVVAQRDVQLALVPDRHNAEMTAAVRGTGRSGDFWISDNPYATAAAGRDVPGPLVDTSGQRTSAGLLTVADLEAARLRYRVQWLLEDSFRLDAVPGYRSWLDEHYRAIEQLGGRAVIYHQDSAP
jgi:dolichyl-phosphate-mannose-protein mannosyltransferase